MPLPRPGPTTNQNDVGFELDLLLDAYADKIETNETAIAALGNSATRNVGTTTGTVAAGNDSRFGAAAAYPTAWIATAGSAAAYLAAADYITVATGPTDTAGAATDRAAIAALCAAGPTIWLPGQYWFDTATISGVRASIWAHPDKPIRELVPGTVTASWINGLMTGTASTPGVWAVITNHQAGTTTRIDNITIEGICWDANAAGQGTGTHDVFNAGYFSRIEKLRFEGKIDFKNARGTGGSTTAVTGPYEKWNCQIWRCGHVYIDQLETWSDNKAVYGATGLGIQYTPRGHIRYVHAHDNKYHGSNCHSAANLIYEVSICEANNGGGTKCEYSRDITYSVARFGGEGPHHPSASETEPTTHTITASITSNVLTVTSGALTAADTSAVIVATGITPETTITYTDPTHAAVTHANVTSRTMTVYQPSVSKGNGSHGFTQQGGENIKLGTVDASFNDGAGFLFQGAIDTTEGPNLTYTTVAACVTARGNADKNYSFLDDSGSRTKLVAFRSAEASPKDFYIEELPNTGGKTRQFDIPSPTGGIVPTSSTPFVPAASTDLVSMFPCTMMIAIVGGAGVALTIDGTTVMHNGTIFVQPGQTINLGAYTVAPTWQWTMVAG